MPNKQLTATVRLNTTQAEKKLKQIARSIDILNRSVGKSSNAYNQVNNALQNSTNTTKKAKVATDQWANSASKVNKNFKSGESTLSRMSRSLRNMLAAYVGVMGMRAVLNTSDTVTSTENRLNAINGNNAQLTNQTMDKAYAASMRSRSNYSDMISNVSKSMTLAGGAFGNNVDNAIRFQEIMAKSYALGGASAAEQSSSMYQLIQALGSGVLQGDELRSVREGAPLAYNAIEKFAQGVLDTDESLKELASQGKITSEMVVAAIMDTEQQINDSFKKTKMTFAQAGNMIKNMAVQAFKPVLQMLNDALNSDAGQAILNGIGKAFVIVADTILWVAEKIEYVINWIADNWDWLKYLLIVGLTILVGYLAWYTAQSIAGALQRMAAWAMENATMLGVLVTIGLLVAGIVWLANTTSSGCEFMVLALLLVATAVLTIGVIVNSTALIIVGIILLLVAVIVALMGYCGGEVIGIIYAIGAVFHNVAMFIANIFAACVLVIATVFANMFNDVAHDFWNFIAELMDGLDWLSKPLEAIAELFGKSFDYENFVAEIRHKAEGFNEQYDVGEAWKNGMNTFEYKDVGEAYEKGYAKGNEWANAIDEFGNSIKEKISGFGQNNSFDNRLLDPYSDAYNLGTYSPDNLLKNIDSNVGDIKDSMDLSHDDMEYLRRIAEMEWRNEFTTAEIRVDMTNNNTVTGERDLDGMVAYLSDTLREELTAISNGVHIDD